MSNPIDRVLDPGVRRISDRTQPQAPGGATGGRADASQASTVSSTLLDLTGRAQELQALEAELGQTTEFDAARVNALRDALSDGSYQVDPKRIADKLLALEAQLP